MNMKEISEIIEHKILLIRGQKVMLDSDLAELYGVTTGNLNLAVRRNIKRFPRDFMLQLTGDEQKNLILQSAISSSNHGGKRKLPYAFTEHGVAMLSSVLRSERAVQMNIFIIRAFIKIRDIISTHKDLAIKLEELENRQDRQGEQLASVCSIVKQLINPPSKESKSIGFETQK